MAWTSTDLTTARDLWADAPLDDTLLDTLLTVAYDQCVSFAPEVTAPTDEQQSRFQYAQVMQARALHRAGAAGGGNAFGAEGFQVTVFPMDWTVKALLRPARKPVVG